MDSEAAVPVAEGRFPLPLSPQDQPTSLSASGLVCFVRGSLGLV
jgi:hypothetical protein